MCCKWCLADKQRTMKLETHHIHDYIALSSNIQNKTVARKSHSSVIKSLSHSAAFLSYSIKRRVRSVENVIDISMFSIRYWKSGYHYLMYSSHFLLDGSIHPVYARRTLVLVFHCSTVYKQLPPSLHRQHFCAV